MLAIAQAVGMVPAADNSFKYKVSSKGGLKGGKTTAVKKVGIYDQKHEGRGGRTRNVVMDHKQWDNHQTQALLLRYVIDNIFGAEMNIIN